MGLGVVPAQSPAVVLNSIQDQAAGAGAPQVPICIGMTGMGLGVVPAQSPAVVLNSIQD